MTIQITPQLLPAVSVRAVNPDGSVVVQPTALQKVVVQPAKPVVAVTVAYGSEPGPSGPTTTDELPEGVTNLYFSDARAQAALAGSLSAYAELSGADFTGPVTTPDVTMPTGNAGKVRLFSLASLGVGHWGAFSLNANYNAGWFLDDTAKDGWYFNMDARATSGNTNGLFVFQVPAGAGDRTAAQLTKFGVTPNFIHIADAMSIGFGGADTVAPTAGYKVDVNGPVKVGGLDVVAAGNADFKLSGGAYVGTIRQGSDGFGYWTAGGPTGFAFYVNAFANQIAQFGAASSWFAGHVATLTADPYAAGWNGSLRFATQDAVYDKMEALDAAKVSTTLLGVADGVATLGPDGKVPTGQLPPAVAGGLSYAGVWDASTNTPVMPSAASAGSGAYYKVSVAGSTNIDGIAEWAVGDWVVSNGTTWDKIDNSETVSSVAGKTGAVVLAKADVGLGSVDNTSDANKPVSTAQQTALDQKLDDSQAGVFGLSMLGTATVAAAKALLSLVKGDVGLGNVDNTSDANKPVSTAQQTALDAKSNARPAIGTLTASRAASDSDNNSHMVGSGAGQTLTLGSITAGTSFTVRFTTAWSLSCAGGMSKNGAATTGVTTGSIAANSLITFLHEGSGVWVVSGSGLT